MKTLIVDDEPLDLLVLQDLMENYGSVRFSTGGREAIDAVRGAREEGAAFDLVCLDMIMPGVDGREALKAIRAEEETAGILLGDGVKIIMTTGQRGPKTIVESFRNACDGYVIKPVEKEKMHEELKVLQLI